MRSKATVYRDLTSFCVDCDSLGRNCSKVLILQHGEVAARWVRCPWKCIHSLFG